MDQLAGLVNAVSVLITGLRLQATPV